jgi:hypothetical protein
MPARRRRFRVMTALLALVAAASVQLSHAVFDDRLPPDFTVCKGPRGAADCQIHRAPAP